jgi:hypothetical protein
MQGSGALPPPKGAGRKARKLQGAGLNDPTSFWGGAFYARGINRREAEAALNAAAAAADAAEALRAACFPRSEAGDQQPAGAPPKREREQASNSSSSSSTFGSLVRQFRAQQALMAAGPPRPQARVGVPALTAREAAAALAAEAAAAQQQQQQGMHYMAPLAGVSAQKQKARGRQAVAKIRAAARGVVSVVQGAVYTGAIVAFMCCGSCCTACYGDGDDAMA